MNFTKNSDKIRTALIKLKRDIINEGESPLAADIIKRLKEFKDNPQGEVEDLIHNALGGFELSEIEGVVNNLFSSDEEDLILAIQSGPQISGFIMRLLEPVAVDPKQGKYKGLKLEQLAKVSDVIIGRLGWIEHTSDWDPYLEIEFRDGTAGATNSGYHDFEVDSEKDVMIIDAPDSEPDSSLDKYLVKEGEYCRWIIQLDAIKSVRICEN